MTINEMQDEIVEEFSVFDEWLDKYEYLIELSRELPAIDEKHRVEQYLIKGCQSRVWVDAELKDDGRIYFTADSDAIITKGIIALLIRVMNGRTPDEIIDADLYFIDRIGLRENLSYPGERVAGDDKADETVRAGVQKQNVSQPL